MTYAQRLAAHRREDWFLAAVGIGFCLAFGVGFFGLPIPWLLRLFG